jgi:hypothetical protein
MQQLVAQQELVLSTQPNVVSSSQINPAYFPEGKKVYIGLPGLSFDAWHSGKITYKDIFQNSGGKRTINLDQLINKLNDQNTLGFYQRTETVAVGFKVAKHFTVMGHHAIRTQAQIQYPKTAAQLLWQGNAQFIGQKVDISPKINFLGYNELGFGLAYQYQKLNIAVRGKYLSGLGFVQTEQFSTSIYTDPDIYQLTLDSKISLLSSGLLQGIDTTSGGFDVSLANFETKKLFTKNTGYGLDLGVTYKLNEKVTLAASALDLGAHITWETDVKRFESEGEFTYNGVFFDGNTFLTGNDEINVDAQIDSLQEIFQFTSAAAEFKQTLAQRFYVNALYQQSAKLQFGLAISASTQKGKKNLYGLGASVAYRPIKWANIGLMLNTSDHTHVNLGALLDLNFGPVRTFITADNVLSSLAPLGQANVNVRYGFGLVF